MEFLLVAAASSGGKEQQDQPSPSERDTDRLLRGALRYSHRSLVSIRIEAGAV